jgi:hypothetical protein
MTMEGARKYYFRHFWKKKRGRRGKIKVVEKFKEYHSTKIN